MERPGDQRFWAFLAHFCVALAFPDFFFPVAFYTWRLIPPTMPFNPVALVPMAPFASYLIYRAQRRRPEKEWAAFHALQAVFLQLIVFLVRFTVPMGWYVKGFPAGVTVYAATLVVIVYGLAGAVAAYVGRDFLYPGVGRLAMHIVRRSPQRS